MLEETDIIPYHSSAPPGERVIILAPHPDDETLGCGGTITLLLDAGKSVRIVFLTSGDKGDPDHRLSHGAAYAVLREKEAVRALRVLGASDFEFLRFPDREVSLRREEIRARLLEIVNLYKPDSIYSPSMVELNPDHRATAALALDLQRFPEGSFPVRLVFYEVAAPLRPNLLVDITPVYRRKRRAVRKYRSQLKVTDYLGHATALNTMRALTVKDAEYVEAFWTMEAPLGEEERSGWLSYGRAVSEQRPAI